MKNFVKITKSGVGNSIQDSGRFGYRQYGVPISGMADSYFASCANALVGNELNQPVIEIPLAGPNLFFECSTRSVALVGKIRIKQISKNGNVTSPQPWKAFRVEAGDIVELSGTNGTAYLSIQGGLELQAIMNSCSTYERAKLGGLNGTWLNINDTIPLRPITTPQGLCADLPFAHETGPLRVIPGPQEFLFKQDSLYKFVTNPYTVSKQWDRMGIRLDGEPLEHLSPSSADIASDGIVPGTIQVPASGAPIILGIDSQTIGGYPKIATIISADISRLAHLRTGDQIEFKNFKIDDAIVILKQKKLKLHRWIEGLKIQNWDNYSSHENNTYGST
ncbi:MAG: biotin-dependent carboxyltransferase family protein [Alphaproteobacteria bacterium]|jgi:hypothetical protein|nr:biotin-dependent carboxyltransferase family protein [Alphaproteobacteria bacterium]